MQTIYFTTAVAAARGGTCTSTHGPPWGAGPLGGTSEHDGAGQLHEVEQQRQRLLQQQQQQRSGQRGLSSVAIQGPIKPIPGPSSPPAPHSASSQAAASSDESCRSLQALPAASCGRGGTPRLFDLPAPPHSAVGDFFDAQPPTPGGSSSSSSSHRDSSHRDAAGEATAHDEAGWAETRGEAARRGGAGGGFAAGSYVSGEGSTGGGANRGGIEGCGTHDQGGTRSNSSWSGGAQCFPHFAVLHMLQKTIRSKGPMAR